MKNMYRRWISGILVAVLVLTSLSTDAYAATGKLASAAAEIEQQQPRVIAFPDTKLEELEGTESVYFGSNQVYVDEGDAYYSFLIHREGDLQTEASVSLLSLDVSALYGKDYEFVDLDVYESGEEMTLLEKSSGKNEIVSNEESWNAFSQLQTEYTAQSEKATLVTEENSSEQIYETNDEIEQSEDSDDDDDDEIGSITKSILSEYIGLNTDPEKDEELSASLNSSLFDYSAGTVLHFAKEEKEKLIKIHVMEDELEEGQELFQLMLADADGTVIRGQYILGVVINDNEELHDAQISFIKDSYESENGTVTISVKRTGSLYSMIDFQLKSVQDTAISGENYEEFNETIVMQPYQTEAVYSFKVSGEGRMEVFLQAETGCVVEGEDTAEVEISESDSVSGPGTESIIFENDEKEESCEKEELLSEEKTGGTFTRKFKDINGKETTYTITYDYDFNKQPCNGVIWDDSKPQVKVGDYIFLSNSQFKFGLTAGKHTSKGYYSEFKKGNSDDQNYGWLLWEQKGYGPGKYGWAGLETNDQFKLSSSYYGYIMPEWEGNGDYASQKFRVYTDKTGDKPVEAKYDGSSNNNKNKGVFLKKVDTEKKISLPLTWIDRNYKLYAETADDSKNHSTRCELKVYGFFCMYKAYKVRISGYEAKDYETAGGGTLKSIPFRIKYEAGKISDAAEQYHTIYADSKEKKSVIQFSPSNVYLNGSSGIFGEIKSFKITYNAEGRRDQQRELIYPDGFVQFLKEHKKDYYKADSKLSERIATAEDITRVTTISLDHYMLDWLQYEGIQAFGSNANNITMEKEIALDFQPVIGYSDINVYVDAPTIKSDPDTQPLNKGTSEVGEFSDPKFAVTKDQDKPEVYHAGDTLNLSAKVNSTGYVYEGFEYSYDDNGYWNFSTKSYLQLMRPYREVRIRPVFSSVKNRIEITMTPEARKHLTINNLIDEEDLEDTVYQGKYIYNVNPSKTDVIEKAKPAVGQVYNIEIEVKDANFDPNSNYVYRPVIKDYHNKEYRTQIFPLIANSDRRYNQITIDAEKVLRKDIKTYKISGIITVDSSAYMQRDNATIRNLVGISGYSISAAGAQIIGNKGEVLNNEFTTSNTKGEFILENIPGKAGDNIPLLIQGASTSGTVKTVKLGSQNELNIGKIITKYPIDAPQVTSVMYSYDNADNNLDHDTNQNSVNIYDDNLLLQFTVDARGQVIKEVIGNVLSVDGEMLDFSATQVGNTDVWTAKIYGMTKKLYNGDRLYVQIKAQDNRVKEDPSNQAIKGIIGYPMMDTGIVFYEKQTAAVKQKLDITTSTENINIPKLGKGNSTAGYDSGVISWNTEPWGGDQGYTMSINIGTSTGSKALSTQNRLREEYIKNVKDYYQGKGKNVEFSESMMRKVNGIKEPQNDKERQKQNEDLSKKQKNDGQANSKAKGWDKSWTADSTILVSLNFINDGHGNYDLLCGALSIGFTVGFNASRFQMIFSIPGYLFAGGKIQSDVSIFFTGAKGKDSLRKGTFEKTGGNIKDTLSQYDKKDSTFLFGFKAYGGLGVGINSVFGIKGIIDFAFQQQLPFSREWSYSKNVGTSIEVGGGIKIDLWVTSLYFTIARFYKGWGTLANKKNSKVSDWKIFHAPATLMSGAQLETETLRKTELLSSDANEKVMLAEILAGSGDMEDFGKEWHVQSLLGASSGNSFVDPVPLKTDVADYAGIRSEQISEDGDLFMVFLDSREGHDSGSTKNGNAQALFYTLYDASERTWTTPQILDTDGTFDTAPDLNVHDDIVTVSWSSSEEEFTKGMTKLDQLSELRIKTAVFRVRNNIAELISEPVFVSGRLASPSVAKKNMLSADKVEEGTDTETEIASIQDEGADAAENAEFMLSGLDDLDIYYDIDAQSWQQDGKIYSVFTRYDLESVDNIEDAVDFTKVKPAVYLAEYDMETRQLLSLRNISLTVGDTILLNTEVQVVEVSGIDWRGKKSDNKHFMVISYTQDTDGDLETVDDNDLKLCLVEIRPDSSTPFIYPSMEISDENGYSEFSEEENSYPEEEELVGAGEGLKIPGKSQYKAKITQAGDSYYLTYLKDGYLFELVDIGDYIEGMFEADYTSEYYRNKAENINSGLYACTENSLIGSSEENAWYCSDMDELNDAWVKWSGENDALWVAEEEEDEEEHIEEWIDLETGETVRTGMYYNDSILKQISLGELTTYETILSGDSNKKNGAEDYQIVTDGKDLYILYLYESETELRPGNELFCVRFTDTGDLENDEILKHNGYSDPVQITDSGYCLDEISATMANGTIRVVSEYYNMRLLGEGETGASGEEGIEFSKNNIAMLEFKPSSRMEIPSLYINYKYAYNVDEEEDNNNYLYINYLVENDGLKPQKGYQTWVLHDDEKIFAEKVSETESSDELPEGSDVIMDLIEPGEIDEFEFYWKLPETGQDETLTFVVADLNGTILNTTDLEIESETVLEVTETDAYKTENGYEASITLVNNGNLPSVPTVMSLNLLKEDFEIAKEYTTVIIPSMKPGEERTFEVPFDLIYTDYVDQGALILEAEFPEETGEGAIFYYLPGDPDTAVIGDGREWFSIRPGSQKLLDAKVYPFPEKTGTVLYTSSDPAVAEVAEDGTVYAHKCGTAVLTAYFERWDLEETVTVGVSYSDSEDSVDSTSEILPSYVEINGTWKQDAKGNWVYTTRAGVKAADRWMAIARSTFGGGKGFEWYRFDKNGNMVTGWFKDSDDRMYYLQMISDGNKGRMLTGWQKIDNKWYYFSSVSNGYKGEMLKNTTTPDGYKVGKDGVWLEK